jgi:hypothetical protein
MENMNFSRVANFETCDNFWICENCDVEPGFDVVDHSDDPYGDLICESCGCCYDNDYEAE